VLGDPLWVIAVASDQVDVYAVMDRWPIAGGALKGLQDPPAFHLCVTLRHCRPGVVDRFLADLQASVGAVKANPAPPGSMAPIYGMTGATKTRGTVEELLDRYGDLQFKA